MPRYALKGTDDAKKTVSVVDPVHGVVQLLAMRQLPILALAGLVFVGCGDSTSVKPSTIKSEQGSL